MERQTESFSISLILFQCISSHLNLSHFFSFHLNPSQFFLIFSQVFSRCLSFLIISHFVTLPQRFSFCLNTYLQLKSTPTISNDWNSLNLSQFFSIFSLFFSIRLTLPVMFSIHLIFLSICLCFSHSISKYLNLSQKISICFTPCEKISDSLKCSQSISKGPIGLQANWICSRKNAKNLLALCICALLPLDIVFHFLLSWSHRAAKLWFT